MDESSIRKQLEEAKRSLAKIEAERDVWLSLLKGYEGWLRLHSSEATTTPLFPIVERRKRAKNPLSFRKAVRRVLQEAHGEPLREEEIVRRVKSMGVEVKKPEAWIGFTVRKEGAEKTAKKTWRWPDEKRMAP